MAASAMGAYLARVARSEREAQGRKPHHIAYTPNGTEEEGVNPSTVWRFEQEERWPRNPDRMIDRYASDLDIAPIELWSRALELWRDDELKAGGAQEPGPDLPPRPDMPLDGVADRLTGTAKSTPPPAPDRRRSEPAKRRRKSA